jgi:hypothetical protein
VTRKLLQAIARGLIGALLFAQMAVAAYACPGLASTGVASKSAATQMDSPSDVIAAAPARSAEQPSRCEDMSGAMDPAFPNLCAEHCRHGQQSDQTPTLVVPAVILMALYSAPSPLQATVPSHPAAATMDALVAASPPHTILHCVFRI